MLFIVARFYFVILCASPRHQTFQGIRAFSEVVQGHLRSLPPNGRVTSTELTTMLEDAIQATVSANAEDDGFQHVACMAKRLNDDSDEKKASHRLESTRSE